MQLPWNTYGDRLVTTTGTHGADISSQRLDNLDLQSLRYALESSTKPKIAVDMGCGLGVHGLRLAMLGFSTTAYDWLPVDATIFRMHELANMFPISYLERDIRLLTTEDLPDSISICYSQRFIHYLTYQEAEGLLQRIRHKTVLSGRLFLSASGLGSELSLDYVGLSIALDNRFNVLAPKMALKHGIFEPVCLYSQGDLIRLCQTAGFAPINVTLSDFGNVKGIFEAI